MRKQFLPSALLLFGAFVLWTSSSSAEQSAESPKPTVTPSVLQPEHSTPAIAQQAVPAAVPDPAARGLDLNADGSLTAQVTFLEGGTLKLKPVPGATVSFVQRSRIIAQTRTDQQGQFTLQGLSPWSVYSVFVNSPEWFAAFSTYTRPMTPTAAGDKPVANKTKKPNQLAFLADVQVARMLPQDLMGVGSGSPIQAVPTGDFAAFMGQQQGTEQGAEPIGAMPVFGTEGMAGGFVGGMGGGMGGGGGAGMMGGGIGGALGAVGLAIGVAALADEDDDNPPVITSPFTTEPVP